MFDLSRTPRRVDPSTLAAAFVIVLICAMLDRPLAIMAAGLRPGTERVGAFVTAFGLSGYMFLISAVIAAGALWLHGRTEDRLRRAKLRLIAERALFFFAAIGVSGIVVQIIKHIVGRTRPTQVLSVGAFHFEPFSAANAFASFPSGHTVTAFSAAVALSFIAPWARPLWFGAAIAIALSRIVVHAHYPTDVLAGAVLGSVSALVTARWFAARSIAFDPTTDALRLKTAPNGRRS